MENEPTSARVERLLQYCYTSGMSRRATCVFITENICDKSGRISMNPDDLVGLILTVARNFEE